MSEEKIFTHRTGDLRHQMCKCADCGIVTRCIPSFDFYGNEGDPLQCESCMMKGVSTDKPLMHIVETGDGPKQVSKDEFVAAVEEDEDRERAEKFLCATCKHENTDKNPFCKGRSATVCMDYEIHATKREVAGLEAEVERLRRCMDVAGLQAFMRGKGSQYVADHLREVAESWGEIEKQRNELVRVLADLFEWEDKSYVHAVMHVENAVNNLRADLAIAKGK